MWRRIFATTVSVLALWGATAGCGSTDPVQKCKDIQSTVCQRAYECFSETERRSQAFIGTFGASQNECVSKLQSVNCANVTRDKPCTDSSKTYYPDKADACNDDLKKASCETFRQGTFASGNCSKICM
jgi:hypothetical protein